MSEIWKDIRKYQGLYQVSNTGFIKTLRYNRILKDAVNDMGWRGISLRKNQENKYFMVHKLVAKAFIPNPNGWSGVAVKKYKTDCSVPNLRWVENAQDRKAPREELIAHYESCDQSKWWPLQKMLYKYFITQDSSHIEYIFKRSYKKWYGHLLKLTHDEPAAQDILQDCYFYFMEAIDSGRFRIDRCFVDYAPDSFIMRIVRNQGCNWLKSDKPVLIDQYFYDGNYSDYDGEY